MSVAHQITEVGDFRWACTKKRKESWIVGTGTLKGSPKVTVFPVTTSRTDRKSLKVEIIKPNHTKPNISLCKTPNATFHA
jgi:hypothetical protein